MTTVTRPAGPALPEVDGVTFRLFRSLDDIPGMAASNGRHRAWFGVLDPIDVERMRNHYQHLEHSDATTDCLLAQVDGETIGYVRCEWHDLHAGDRSLDTTVAVDPAHWGRGVTRALLAWSEQRLREIERTLPPAPRTWLATEVFGTEGEPMTAARELGYEVARPWAEMLRPTLDDPLPNDTLPAGYEWLPLGRQDSRAVWEMLDVTFARHWGEWSAGEEGYLEWVNDPGQDPSLWVAATDGTGIASIVLNILNRQPDGSVRGELSTVGTHPDHRRRGLARTCIGRSLQVLRGRGATSAWLGVDMLNEDQALSLYESCGFEVVTRGFSLRKPLDREAA